MNLLLDTHTVLWFWWDDKRLGTLARQLICNPAHRKLISLATPWELAIKVSLNKLSINRPFSGLFAEHMDRTNFEWLATTDAHFNLLTTLPFHHRDPFDRMLAAQSLADGIPLVSADVVFDTYGVQRLWN